MTLGNDFTGEESSGSSGEAEQINSDEKLEKESEDSAENADSENEVVESKDETAEDDKSVEEESKEETPKEESKIEGKVLSDEEKDQRELQGLLDTEKSLDGDNSEIKTKISAARERIAEKRRARREGRDLVDTIGDALPPDLSETNADDLADIDPDTIKVLERFTKARGLVPKAELVQITYQGKHKDAEKAFYATHKEYLPENDADDILYKALKQELSLYATPKDADLIPRLFEKAHDVVAKQYPGKFKIAVTTDKNKIVASAARLKSRSLGGGSTGSGSGGSSASKQQEGGRQFDANQLNALRSGGWSEEEIKELVNK